MSEPTPHPDQPEHSKRPDRHCHAAARSGGYDATPGPARGARTTPPTNGWRIEQIDTEPMTSQHYHLAVTTLATLISQWRHNNETTIPAQRDRRR